MRIAFFPECFKILDSNDKICTKKLKNEKFFFAFFKLSVYFLYLCKASF